MGTAEPGERTWIDEAADRFERQWEAGRGPRIEDYLAAESGPRRARLLEELLRVERELRRRAGEEVPPDAYRRRFPEHGSVVDVVFGVRPNPTPAAPRPPTGSDADRNLLFGVLALQMDFISREALIAAVSAWIRDKTRSLARILVEQGALSEARRALLEPLVDEHLRVHDGDPEKSLASVSSLGSVREALAAVADAEVRASLGHVGAARDNDPDRTPSWSAGQPTCPGGRFRILRFHDRGGRGEVYVARDEELAREVALKQIQARLADDGDARSRFLLEAEITGGLEHPGIVPVYGLGHYEDGRPFYAMRFIKGDSLKTAIARFHEAGSAPRDEGERALELRRLLGRFLDVCNAVAYAHSRGVLHRDLKPGNILLGPYGETLVVDWGMAKVVGRPEGDRTTEEATLRPPSSSGSAETMAGLAIGTPGYMSPEQAAGRLDRLGRASDVYSLGATLYSLLTGKAPFSLKQDLDEVIQRVQRGDFPPPRQINRAVAPALEAICLRAMALRPEDRYPSPRALADDVEQWLADEPVSAYREGWQMRAARWARRHRTLVASLLVLLVTSVVALTSGLVLVDRERAVAVTERNKADQERTKAQAARDDADRAAMRAENARQAADQARAKAETAKTEAIRAALDGFQQTAEASLATARMLRYANQFDPQRQALAHLRTASRAHIQARGILRASGPADGVAAREESRLWEDRVEAMRTEAGHWLTDLEVRRVREITVPAEPGTWFSVNPALAIRDDGRRIALAREDLQGIFHVLVLDNEGVVRHRTTLPAPRSSAPPSPRSSPQPKPHLRFAEPEKIECTSLDAEYILDLTNGRITRRPLERKDSPPANEGAINVPSGRVRGPAVPDASRQTPPSPLEVSPVEVRNDSFVLTWSPRTVTVRPRRPGAEPRTIWQQADNRYGSTEITEICRYAGFLSEPRGVVLVIGSEIKNVQPIPGMTPVGFLPISSIRDGLNGMRLYLADALTGQVREAALATSPNNLASIRWLAPLQGGLATLESQEVENRLDQISLKVVLWSVVLPVVPVESLNAGGRVQALDLSADGHLLAGGVDGLVRAWDGRRPLWSPPSSLQLRLAADRTGGRQLRFGSYGHFKFAAGESLGPVVERSEPGPKDPLRLRTEAFDAVDGRPVGTPPGPGGVAGPSLLISRDLSYALVVSEDHGMEWTLALWSPRQNRLLRRLGRYTKPPQSSRPVGGDVRGDGRVVHHPFFSPAGAHRPFFSPAGRWLFVPAPDASGRGVEFWRLPDAQRIGRAAAQPPAGPRDLTIDPAEAHAVRIGAEVFDLTSGKKLCDLEPADIIGAKEFLLINKELALGTSFYSATRPVYAWDLTTGKKAILGTTDWGGVVTWVGPNSGSIPTGRACSSTGSSAPRPSR
jgi:tRNA A-37 threonylcarbamoyl transferase component Bud32